MDVSIIIVSYNTLSLLRDCIHSIIANTSGVDYEIIVVDNCSTDGSPDMVGRNFPQIKLIRNRGNVGFGIANNQGFRIAKGEYILFLNSDTLLISNAIRDFIEFMGRKGNHDVFACGGLLIQPNDTPIISCGNFPSILEIILHKMRLFWILPRFVRDRISSTLVPNAAESSVEVDYVSGADLFLRKSIIGSVPPFDEDFFLYFEEVEFCHRMHDKGFRAVIVPDIKIIHLFGQSSRENDHRQYEINETSRFLYFRKCHGIAAATFLMQMNKAGCLLKYITTFNKRHFKSYLFYRELELKHV